MKINELNFDEVKAVFLNIKPGVIVWKVHAFNNEVNPHAFVSEYLINSAPYISKHSDALFVAVFDVKGGYKTEISLGDAGFPSGNTYNDHKLFFSKYDAEQYVADVVAGTVKSRKKCSLIEDDFLV